MFAHSRKLIYDVATVNPITSPECDGIWRGHRQLKL